jgi:Na+-transporting NADH:ubiquinone oxidoreductase subunit NqrB
MSDKSDATDQLNRALQRLADERGPEAAAMVAPIVWDNYRLGRIDIFVDDTGGETRFYEYVVRVADGHAQWSRYLEQLQVEKDRATREALFTRLQTWAYNFLGNQNARLNGVALTLLALECATTALHVLLSTRFPYDVHFDAWACVVLNNVCRRRHRPEHAAGQGGYSN